jgi:hypothetical protein
MDLSGPGVDVKLKEKIKKLEIFNSQNSPKKEKSPDFYTWSK